MTTIEIQAWIFFFAWIVESICFLTLWHEYNKLKEKAKTE